MIIGSPLIPDLTITSSDNPKIKLAKSLRNRRERDEMGLFLIEGYRELSRATTSEIDFHTLFYCPDLFLGTNEKNLLIACRKKKALLIEVSQSLFEKISYRDRPDGLLGIAYKMNYSQDQIINKIVARAKPPLCILAEAIEKPGNLGTILRSADAAGADVVIIANGCTDIYNPNVVRASVGTLFTLPILDVSNEEALDFCNNLQLTLIAASPEGKNLYTDIPMKQPIGIIVGTEQLGLSTFWKEKADILAKIPMHGVSDSLNVATATTLFLFEAVRQRDI